MNKDLRLEDIPKPDEGASFSALELRTVTTPHPYCITARHVEYAADKCSGVLTEKAIQEAERVKGINCGICKRPRAEHHEELVLVIQVECDAAKPADVPGLQDYLEKVVDTGTVLGLDGFLFVRGRKKKQ